MKLKVKSRSYEWLVVVCFLFAFLIFLSNQILLGFLLGFVGLYLIVKQDKALHDEGPDSSGVSYAGFWVRCGSLLVDGGIFCLWFMFLFLVLGNKLFDYFIYFFYLFSWVVVQLFMLEKWGQTPGKMLMGIKVVKTDFSKLTWREAFLRLSLEMFTDTWYLLKACLIFGGFITTGLFLSGTSTPHTFPSNFFKIVQNKLINLNMIWTFSEMFVLLLNLKRRALHDFLAGTVVIVKEKVGSRSELWAVFFFLIFFGYLKFFFFDNNVMTRALAEKGEPQSEASLGYIYYKGKYGKPQVHDCALALQWFQKAADQEDERGQYYLGEMYEKGCGVTVDRAKALAFYSLAAEQNYRPAKKALIRLGNSTLP